MSDCRVNPDASKLAPPDDSSLPVFVYGTLMEGQPGFHQLKKFAPRVRTAQVPGLLYLRDGLPLLDVGNDGPVKGQLLEFLEESREQAVGIICQFEPPEQYEWRQVETLDGVRANALQGRYLNKGGAEPAPENRWSLDMDPVFSDALDVVRATAKVHAGKEFPNAPSVDWNRAFHIQMAYLLLWSVLERFSALAIGPAVNPNKRISELGRLGPVLDAVKSLDSPVRKVFDSRKPNAKPYVLDVREKPEKAMDYYYAIRSNLSHRGKGAWSDAETVRKSLNELLQIITAVLKNSGKQNP